MKEFVLAEGWYWFIVMAVVSYLVGCFNFALLISKLKHSDVRKIGSGNPGTMNMSRAFGLKVGAITLLCDLLKGGIPAIISYFIFKQYYFAGTTVIVSDFTRYWCALFVILGHIFPVTMHFKGGKGVGSTLGAFWLSLSCEEWWLCPVILLVGGAIVIGYIFWSEMGSAGSFLGITILTVIQSVFFYLRYSECLSNPYVIIIFMLLFMFTVITWAAHHQNIMRLFAGEEHRTSVRKLAKGKASKEKV